MSFHFSYKGVRLFLKTYTGGYIVLMTISLFFVQSHSVLHNPLPPSSNKHRKSGIHTYNWTLINSVGFPSGNLDLIKMPYLIFCTAHISNYKKGLQLFFLHYHYNIFGSLHNKKGGDNEDFCYMLSHNALKLEKSAISKV